MKRASRSSKMKDTDRDDDNGNKSKIWGILFLISLTPAEEFVTAYVIGLFIPVSWIVLGTGFSVVTSGLLLIQYLRSR